MKKIPVLLFALLTMSIWLFPEVKIGIINPPVVLQNSIKGKEAINRLKTAAEANQKKFEQMQQAIDSLEKEVLSPALNEDTRSKKNLDLQNKKTEQKRFAEDAQNESRMKQQAEFEGIQKELMPIIEKIAKDEGYTLILDITTAGVAYVDPTSDITEKVVKAYDASLAATAKPK
jgi:outer membrane protein